MESISVESSKMSKDFDRNKSSYLKRSCSKCYNCKNATLSTITLIFGILSICFVLFYFMSPSMNQSGGINKIGISIESSACKCEPKPVCGEHCYENCWDEPLSFGEGTIVCFTGDGIYVKDNIDDNDVIVNGCDEQLNDSSEKISRGVPSNVCKMVKFCAEGNICWEEEVCSGRTICNNNIKSRDDKESVVVERISDEASIIVEKISEEGSQVVEKIYGEGPIVAERISDEDYFDSDIYDEDNVEFSDENIIINAGLKVVDKISKEGSKVVDKISGEGPIVAESNSDKDNIEFSGEINVEFSNVNTTTTRSAGSIKG